MKILQYLSLALEIGGTVESITELIAAKQPLTGPEIVTAVQPVISGIQATFNVTMPTALVTDIAATAADAVNKYVLKVA